MARRHQCSSNREIAAAGDRRQLREAQPAHAHAEPGDVRRRGGQRAHDDPVLQGPRLVDARTRTCSPASSPLFLWFTVLFANFAEAVAEGRGKAQADTLRKTRSETMAHRRRPDGTLEEVPSTALDVGDEVVVVAGEIIPSDGDVVEGIASIDESAITGESAPVIRESGGDRSAVTGGTRVLSDEIVVRITARPGRDVHRPDDRARRGVRAPEDAERDRAQHPARRAHDHLPARDRDPAAVRDLRRTPSSRSSCSSRCSCA